MPSQWEDRSKPHRNIVFIGHVDHGKSTTVGRLLLDSGHIEEHVIEKNEKLAAESGKAVSVLRTSWTDSRKSASAVLPSTSLTRSSSPLTTTGPSLTLQVTATSSRT